MSKSYTHKGFNIHYVFSTSCFRERLNPSNGVLKIAQVKDTWKAQLVERDSQFRLWSCAQGCETESLVVRA